MDYVGLELARFAVPSVWGVEADGQTERLSIGGTVEELQRLVPKPGGRVGVRRIIRIDEPFAGLAG